VEKIEMHRTLLLSALLLASTSFTSAAQDLQALKREAVEKVGSRAKLTQEIVDSLFSFAELGFQEVETKRYLTGILRENGFEIEENVAGIPTAWTARWGSGEPVIGFISDVDGLPNMSQKPATVFYDPIVEGAPGHGEGHNSGMAINVVAALALKEIMERDGVTGTLLLVPGIAEEQLATKQHLIASGALKDVDIMIGNHVGDELSTTYGPTNTMALISAEYTFHGVSAHGAVNPWEGKSALDAVELMNAGWNFRREHLRPAQRSHYVISDGGDQPNVVPPIATVWYYFRETDPGRVKENFETANRIAQGAALMTDTEVERRLLGSAWPHHYNQPLAEAMNENIKVVGVPEWDEKDQELARAVQALRGVPENGLKTKPGEISVLKGEPTGGPSDDIGTISWNIPTTRLRFPSNIPGAGSHNWTAAIAMATPIAHKGALAGAKVTAMTALDILMKPELREAARNYFDNVQTKDMKYEPFETPEDKPAIHLNAEIQAEYRPELSKYYYDPTKYSSYLEQLGIEYPTLDPKN
jgi:aminobenzoyl-glutamate utilization protein B